MAKAYPKSKFIGFDNHPASIERARELAKEEGLCGNQISFEISSATDYPLYSNANKHYDLIAFFDCLHDLGDPVGAASHALKSLMIGSKTTSILWAGCSMLLQQWRVFLVQWLAMALL
jgi:SAM-dependent methyltransferase